MQSTVIINCNRGRGGFIFDTGYGITIEGLTITNCGQVHFGVFHFTNFQEIFFLRNSLQFMSGNGLATVNCDYVVITNCSYYRTANHTFGRGLSFDYHYSKNLPKYFSRYTLEVTYSNMTKCSSYGYGGGIQLRTGKYTNVPIDVVFSHLVLSHNRASKGGGLSADLKSKVSIAILNSKFLYGVATGTVGGALIQPLMTETYITIKDTIFVENSIISKKTSFIDNKPNESELFVNCGNGNEFVQITVSLLDSTIVHTGASSNQVVRIVNCATVNVLNTKLRMANQKFAGFVVNGVAVLQVANSQFEGCYNLPSVILLKSKQNWFLINNSSFSNNTGGRSVITLHNVFLTVINSSISDNSMTGITAFESRIKFQGRNVIQNNRYTEGAGIMLPSPSTIIVASGQLHMINNTADNHGGAILVTPVPDITSLLNNTNFIVCSLNFLYENSLIIFSENRAGKGGDDIYGAKLMDCKIKYITDKQLIPHVGQPNQT